MSQNKKVHNSEFAVNTSMTLQLVVTTVYNQSVTGCGSQRKLMLTAIKFDFVEKHIH